MMPTLTETAVKILVVEDDDDLRETLMQSLSQSGFFVESAADGLEGLYQARNWDYDAIILDGMLPELDGWEVLKRIRQEKHTPVLMLTARSGLDDRIHGLDSGADDYMAKPYEPRELVARLRALVRRSTGQTNNEIIVGRVAIDTASQTVKVDDTPAKLSPSQYKIVEHLARRAGTIVSREALCEALLIEDEEAFSNVLDVQIYHIRKRLGKDFLQNRRGVGYIVPLP